MKCCPVTSSVVIGRCHWSWAQTARLIDILARRNGEPESLCNLSKYARLEVAGQF